MKVVPLPGGRAFACVEVGYPTTGFIVGSRAVMVIDTQPSVARARTVIALITDITDRPIARLVLTSAAPARIAGANAYGPYSTIASETVVERIERSGHDDMARAVAAEPWLFGDAAEYPPCLPHANAVFDSRLTVDLGECPVQVCAVADKDGIMGTVVSLAADHVLFAGDLVPQRNALHADAITHWQALFGAATIVPGHGAPACDLKPVGTLQS